MRWSSTHSCPAHASIQVLRRRCASTNKISLRGQKIIVIPLFLSLNWIFADRVPVLRADLHWAGPGDASGTSAWVSASISAWCLFKLSLLISSNPSDAFATDWAAGIPMAIAWKYRPILLSFVEVIRSTLFHYDLKAFKSKLLFSPWWSYFLAWNARKYLSFERKHKIKWALNWQSEKPHYNLGVCVYQSVYKKNLSWWTKGCVIFTIFIMNYCIVIAKVSNLREFSFFIIFVQRKKELSLKATFYTHRKQIYTLFLCH